MRTSRYVMVSYPALAVLLAGSVDAWWANQKLQRVLRKLVPALNVTLGLVGIVLLVLSVQFGWRLGVAGTLLFGFIVAGLVIGRRSNPNGLWLWFAALPMVFFGVFDGGVRPLSTPAPFRMIAAGLLERTPPGGTVYTWQVDETAASQLRLAAHNRIQLQPLVRTNRSGWPPLVLTTTAGTNTLHAVDYDLVPAPVNEQALKVREALRPFRRTDKGRNTAGRNSVYWLASRRREQGASQQP
jgi:hypothetical protein